MIQNHPAVSPAVGPSPDALFQMAFGLLAAKTFLTAVEMNVCGTLAHAPRKLSDLSAHLKLHNRGSRDFLDALVALKILDRTDDADPIYSNTEIADAFLDPAKPEYIGGIFEMMNSRLYPSWGKFADALRTGKPQSEVGDNTAGDTFDAIYDSEEHVERFVKAMTGISLGNANVLAGKLSWSEVKTVADIGCAQGAVPVTLAKRHPHLRAIGFDLPAVRPVYERYVKANGVADRVSFAGGDFFKDDLPRADVLVFGHILHDWDLPTKRMLLRKAYEALPSGGRVVVYDAMIDNARREHVFGLLMSLNMLVETPGGFDYTIGDCESWLKEAGFRQINISPLAGPHWVAIAVK